MIPLITNNLQKIRSACREYDVEALWVFGSAVRGDWVEGKSDIDFIARFGASERSLFRQHMGFIVLMSDILGVPVDVVDSRSIKKPEFRDEVGRTKELLYENAHHTVPAGRSR